MLGVHAHDGLHGPAVADLNRRAPGHASAQDHHEDQEERVGRADDLGEVAAEEPRTSPNRKRQHTAQEFGHAPRHGNVKPLGERRGRVAGHDGPEDDGRDGDEDRHTMPLGALPRRVSFIFLWLVLPAIRVVLHPQALEALVQAVRLHLLLVDLGGNPMHPDPSVPEPRAPRDNQVADHKDKHAKDCRDEAALQVALHEPRGDGKHVDLLHREHE
mmetsp:Transcript_50614/g.156645  ORF Transcript_50614/g.156645 Transcript_50614/m.156645 type:complete len:215 (+) Transcript_50614:1342-1986(+)